MIIALPSKVYILRPKENEDIRRDTEEYSTYFKNIILPYKEEYDIKVECEYGGNFGEFWRICEFPYDRDCFPLTIAVYDEMGIRIAEKSCIICLVDKNKNAEFSVMSIGDSMTHSTKYIEQFVHKLENITTRGLRSFDGHIYMEGRGGWSYRWYFENTTVCWGGVSPFVFPEDVEGKKYYGDIDFEETKKKNDRPTYAYDGLPAFELKDGMIYHKDGKLYQKQDNGDIIINENPRWEFSFKKYIERYNPGHIDAVSLLMGGNDLQYVSYEKCMDVVSQYVENTQKIISSIWEYDKNIKIIINLPVIGAEQYAWGKRLGCVSGSKQYRFAVICAADALIKRFDGCEGVYISGTLLNLDPVFGFDKEPYRANKYCDDYVMKQANWVHPNANGYKQMGDAVAAVIEAIRP